MQSTLGTAGVYVSS